MDSVRSRGVACLALAVSALLGLGGCAEPQLTVPPSGSHAAPTSSAPSTPSGSEGALAAYRAMWADTEKAGRTSDPKAPELDDHASGAALRLLEYGLTKHRDDGVVSKGYVELFPRVVSSSWDGSAAEVKIEDCSDSAHWLLYWPDGKLKDNVPGSHHRTTATARQVDGRWKVVELWLDVAGSC